MGGLARAFGGSAAALAEGKTGVESFVEKFKAVAPSVMEPPKFPTDFATNKMKEVDPAAAHAQQDHLQLLPAPP
eukprot:jgi/Tetstr1/462374/TSEL_007380.t1